MKTTLTTTSNNAIPKFGARYVVRFPKDTISNLPVKTLSNKDEGWRAKIMDEPYFALGNHDYDELFIRDNLAPFEIEKIETQLCEKILPTFVQQLSRLLSPFSGIKLKENDVTQKKSEQARQARTHRIKTLEANKQELSQTLEELNNKINQEFNPVEYKQNLLDGILKKYSAEMVPANYTGHQYPGGYFNLTVEKNARLIRKTFGKVWKAHETEQLQNELNNVFSDFTLRMPAIEKEQRQNLIRDLKVKEADLTNVLKELKQLILKEDNTLTESTTEALLTDEAKPLSKQQQLVKKAHSNNVSTRLNALSELAREALDHPDTLEFADKSTLF